MPTARFGLAASVLGNKLYAVGGSDHRQVLNMVESYDPTSDTWTTEAPMPTARGGLAARVAGHLLVAVGGVGHNRALTTVEAFTAR